jgi:hypothetical protein
MKTTTYTIAQTRVKIRAADPQPETIYLDPTAQDIYIGGDDLTVDNGMRLTKSVITPIFIRGEQELYAICKTGTAPIVILCESP